jgi:hypothetical protein
MMIVRCVAALLLICASAAVSECLDEPEELHATKRKLSVSLDCTKIHRACRSCRAQRQPGTRTTVALCSICQTGWRLRRDGKSRTCGTLYSSCENLLQCCILPAVSATQHLAPLLLFGCADCNTGFSMNGTQSNPQAWCNQCPR